MKPTAPYYLAGEAGKSLDAVQISLADLCCYNATLSLRSLDVDTLTFQILGSRSKVIPADGQWISLYDGTGTRLFTGIAKRTYTHPQGIYSYEVSNVYLGLSQTSLLSANGRPYVTYDQGDLRTSLLSILAAATAEGLPIQAPTLASTPVMFTVPKMSFRAASLAGALEDALKWAPDVTTRMDYATSPPTLRFYARSASSSTTINLDGQNHHATAVQLAAWPEARALSVAFVYAERNGSSVVNYRVQQAGDDTAEARRKLSIYLSGSERTDMMVGEAVASANTAMITANNAVAAINAQLAANAASAAQTLTSQATFTINYNQIKISDLNGGLQSALAADSTFSMTISTAPLTVYNTATNERFYDFGATDAVVSFDSKTFPSWFSRLENSNGSIASGWYPIKDGVITSAQLAIAGATLQTKYYVGILELDVTVGGIPYDGSNPRYRIWADTADRAELRGYTSRNYWDNSGETKRFLYYKYKVACSAINMPISQLAAAVTAASSVASTALIERAEFVSAPPNLAEDYFARQDWTPFKGSLSLDPKATDFPEPGDYLNIAAGTTPAEWASMAAPVSELSINLSTGAAEVRIGPSPRMDFQSLIDRLRIPVEDNYQAG
jgi:hypothetical protein